MYKRLNQKHLYAPVNDSVSKTYTPLAPSSSTSLNRLHRVHIHESTRNSSQDKLLYYSRKSKGVTKIYNIVYDNSRESRDNGQGTHFGRTDNHGGFPSVDVGQISWWDPGDLVKLVCTVLGLYGPSS